MSTDDKFPHQLLSFKKCYSFYYKPWTLSNKSVIMSVTLSVILSVSCLKHVIPVWPDCPCNTSLLPTPIPISSLSRLSFSYTFFITFFLYLQFVSVRYNYRLFTDTLQIAVCGGHTDNWLSIGYILITSGLHLRSEVLSSSSVTSACGCVCQHRKSWIVWDIIVTILQEQDGQQLWRAS